MAKKDLSQVLKIEKQAFEQPYSREIFQQELKIKAAQIWVASYRNRIVGYIDYWVVGDEVELVSIAVHPKYHRKGVALALMEQMLDTASSNAVRSISLDVRVSNKRAQGLYKKFGFEKVGLRKRYYSDKGEDAVIMRKKL